MLSAGCSSETIARIPTLLRLKRFRCQIFYLLSSLILRQLRTLTDFRLSILPFGQCSLTLKPWGNKTLMQSGIMSARSSNIIKYLGNDSRIAPLLLAVLDAFYRQICSVNEESRMPVRPSPMRCFEFVWNWSMAGKELGVGIPK
jgi:hypothetical protein